jgi:hypothetical protein
MNQCCRSLLKKQYPLTSEHHQCLINYTNAIREDADWFIGKINDTKNVRKKVIVSIDNIMLKIDEKSKHFTDILGENQKSARDIFDDDIICAISQPKELKKKNTYSIKDFQKVLKLIVK